MKRLYLPPPVGAGIRTLEAERAHYLKNVLRLKAGDRLRVFDGIGGSAAARLESMGRDLALTIDTPVTADRTEPRIHLAFALLKGKSLEQVLRKSTELGATDLWPIYTDHTHVPRRALSRADDGRSHAIVISAAEQCGQNWLPKMHEGRSLAELVAAPPAAEPRVMDQRGAPWPETAAAQDALLVVGPEGGWSDDERELFERHQWPAATLGPLVLRAETAPLVAITTLRNWWAFAAPKR